MPVSVRCRVSLWLVVLIAVGTGGWYVYRGVSVSVQAERTLHGTVFMAELAGEFVTQKGRWPRSWDELEAFPFPGLNPSFRWPDDARDIRQRVAIDFNADPETILGQDLSSFTAISPIGPNFGRDHCFHFLQAALRKVEKKKTADDNDEDDEEEKKFWPGMWLFGRKEGSMIHLSTDGTRESGVGGLIFFLSDEDPGIRESAASWLGGIGRKAKDALPKLEEKLKDPDADVRQAAAEAIQKIKAGKSKKSGMGGTPSSPRAMLHGSA